MRAARLKAGTPFATMNGILKDKAAMLSPFSCPTLEGTRGIVHLSDPVFISDLHLSDNEPDTMAGFFRFLENEAAAHGELVILGDFFDYWIGDDSSFTVEPIVRALQRWSASHGLFIMQGNRDFMMGERFAREVGGTLLRDPMPVTVGENKTRVLLSHGDIWCTRDEDYQRVRRRVRSLWWQWLVMRLPLKKRIAIAENARMKSKAQKVTKDPSVTDTDHEAIVAAARACGASVVIHGHTHRPSVSSLEDCLVRAVLPDWHFEGERALRGGYIVIENDQPRLHTL